MPWNDLLRRSVSVDANAQWLPATRPGKMSLRFHPAVQRDLNEVLDYQTRDGVKITCVKHEKRHPLRGMQRR